MSTEQCTPTRCSQCTSHPTDHMTHTANSAFSRLNARNSIRGPASDYAATSVPLGIGLARRDARNLPSEPVRVDVFRETVAVTDFGVRASLREILTIHLRYLLFSFCRVLILMPLQPASCNPPQRTLKPSRSHCSKTPTRPP